MSVSLTAVSLGLLVSAGMPTLEAAHAVGPLIVVVMILFGGFYIDVESLPQVADLVPYVSIIRWAFQSFAINEYRGMVFECIPGKKCLQTGEQVLESLGLAGKGLDYSLGGLYLLCTGFVVLAYIVLLRSKAEYSVLNFVGAKYATITKELHSPTQAAAKAAKEVEMTAIKTEDPDTPTAVL